MKRRRIDMDCDGAEDNCDDNDNDDTSHDWRQPAVLINARLLRQFAERYVRTCVAYHHL